jgi:hypothetical protein
MPVKKIVITLMIVLLGIFALWFVHPQMAYLPESMPEEVGLRWQECKQSGGYGTQQQAKECFGITEPIRNGEQNNVRVERIGMENFRMEIGRDIYETARIGNLFGFEQFVLSKNGFPLSFLAGNFYAHSPNIGLQEIGGKSVWEFADNIKATIIYDGQDIRRTMGLDKAQRPYRLGDKLIFIAHKNNKYFVVYDGKRLTPEFDDVIIAYCCEGVLYSPFGGPGFYIFNGTRDGQNYLVEVGVSK